MKMALYIGPQARQIFSKPMKYQSGFQRHIPNNIKMLETFITKSVMLNQGRFSIQRTC